MQTIINNLLGVKVPVQCPSTPEEYNAARKDPNAVMEDALSQAFYRDYNPVVRPLIADELERVTGVTRRNDGSKVKRVKGADGAVVEEPVLITEQRYVNELLDAKAITEADYEKLVIRVAAEYGPLQLGPDVGRSGKPAKKFYEQADAMLSSMNAGTFADKAGQPVTPEIFAKAWTDLNGIEFSTLGAEFDRDTLARALKINEERKQRAATATMSLD